VLGIAEHGVVYMAARGTAVLLHPCHQR
jgi:hypothetical protein